MNQPLFWGTSIPLGSNGASIPKSCVERNGGPLKTSCLPRKSRQIRASDLWYIKGHCGGQPPLVRRGIEDNDGT